MFFFKTEANQNTGGGHLFRCLNIANELKRHGHKSAFIISNSPDHIEARIKSEGYPVFKIRNDQVFDNYAYMQFIDEKSVIIFDTDNPGYYSGNFIDGFRVNEIKTACFTITDKYRISTDLLINPNIISRTHKYNCSEHTILLLGPKYLIFNEKFRNIEAGRDRDYSHKITLFLYFGNSDKNNFIDYFTRILIHLKEHLEKVIIVTGSLNTNIDHINKLVFDNRDFEMELHTNVKEIQEIYQRTDLAITSAGMAMWEMALYKIPQLVAATSERELEYSRYLHDLNYIIKIGDYLNVPTATQMRKKISNILNRGTFKTIKTTDFQKIINPAGIELIVDDLLALHPYN